MLVMPIGNKLVFKTSLTKYENQFTFTHGIYIGLSDSLPSLTGTMTNSDWSKS